VISSTNKAFPLKRNIFIMAGSEGSIVGAIFIMFVVSILLFWAPVFGPVVAGFAGGKKAGGIGGAITATLLPGIAVGVALFLLTGTLAGMPIVGAVAGMGGTILALAHVGPMLLGAIVGGALA
jgi:hypothetical protein